MTTTLADPIAVPTSLITPSGAALRCRHRTLSGRRCRNNISDSSAGLCARHLLLREQCLESADLLLALTSQFTSFTSPAHINDFLSKLQLLLAQKRITARQAGVMAYISSLQLRALTSVSQENERLRKEAANTPPQIIFDIPRPIRD